MSFWVYILECKDHSYYTGHTDNLEGRLYAHEHGILKCYTSSRLPVKLVFAEEFATRDDAFHAERQIKGWTRRKKKALIERDWLKLAEYSKSKNQRPSTGSG